MRDLAIALLALLGGFVASLGDAFPILFALICLDLLASVLASVAQGKLDPELSWKGIARKALEILLVVAGQVEKPLLPPATRAVLPDLSTAIAVGFCISETLNILRHSKDAGLDLPAVFTRLLPILQHLQGEGADEAAPRS